jgi:phage terminase small subunit
MAKKSTSTEIAEDTEQGPAMRGLTERQRNFVMAALADPEGNPTDWARLSGYTDNGKTGIRVLAHRLMRDPRIEAAIVEIARSHFTTGGAALAANNLLRIARNEKHPKHYDATIAIMNRVGMHEKSEHTLKVQRDNSADMEQLAVRLAAELGVNSEALIGGNKPMIDVTPTQVKVEAKPEPDDPFAQGGHLAT